MQVVIRHAVGEGRLLDTDGGGFHDALVRPATPHEVGDASRGDAAEARAARGRRAAPRTRRAVRARLRVASGVTRSCAASRARGRPTRSGSSWSSCCSRRICASSSSTRTRTSSGSASSGRTPTRAHRPLRRGSAIARGAQRGRRPGVPHRGAGGGDPGRRASARPRGRSRRVRRVARPHRAASRCHSSVSSASNARAATTARRLIRRARNLGVQRWRIWAGADRDSVLPQLTDETTSAAWWSTSARSRRGRSRRSPRRRCSASSGGRGSSGARS